MSRNQVQISSKNIKLQKTKVASFINQFEKLSLSLPDAESIDPTPIRSKTEPTLSFRRSATCVDLAKFRRSESAKVQAPQTKVLSRQEFQRQSSIPGNNANSTHKSIRRSPAFRFDAQCRLSLVKNVAGKDPVKNGTDLVDDLDYLNRSETIKKALMRPLPTGSPPKKPPRTFMSPQSNEISPEPKQIFRNSLKISSNTLPKKSEKTEDKKALNNFLSCLISPCSIDPIYYDQFKQEQERSKELAEESIYMEPFAHLSKDFQNNFPSPPKANEELHYMCTVLDPDHNSHSDQNGNTPNSRRKSLESSDIEDYEKINLLFNVVYDEKHRDSIMDETSQSSTDSSSKSSAAANRGVSRSLTEKRKMYVRRMTQISINAKPNDKEIAEFASLRRFPSTARKISQFQSLIDASKEKESQITKKTKDEKLFDVVLLVGFDVAKMSAYIKTVFPKSAKAPDMIEQFVYPTDKTPSDLMTKENQNFCLILTDEYGSHLYAYCRQVVPESFEICLPLTYCIISSTKATGFYYNVLKEIEIRHGQPETHFNFLLRQLQNQELPKSGKFLKVKLMESPAAKKPPEIARKPDRETIHKAQTRLNKRLSLESPEWLRMENSPDSKSSSDVETVNRSLTETLRKFDEIEIRRPNDLRLEHSELNVLYRNTTSELLIIMFGTLLIERKVILIGRNLSQISSCILALNSILYPFQWQHTIITITPDTLNELIQAPFPILAGILKDSVNLSTLEIEDGIVVDLDSKTLLRKCGDDSTLVPDTLKKSLRLSLKIVEAMDREKSINNVLIAEAFLQFFVKIFANFSTKNFVKEKFIESHNDQAIKYFLEWFLETIMFKEFLKHKTAHDKQKEDGITTTSEYFDLFNAKILEKSVTLSNHQQRKNVELLMKNSRQLNKKRNFKDRIKDFLTSGS